MTSASEAASVVAASPAYGGAAIARLDGKVVFVRGAIPGERVRIRIDERSAGYDTATVIGVEEPSPHRVEPACRHFGDCGGCQLQYLSHAGQLELKQDVLKDCLRRIGRTEVDLSPPLSNGEAWAYRVRGQFKATDGTSIGFFRENSREVVDISRCPLMTVRVNDLLGILRRSIGSGSAGFPEEALFSEAHITCGDAPVLFLKVDRGGPPLRGIRKAVAGLIEGGFAGVVVGSPQGKVLSEGAFWTTFTLGNLQYTVSPLSFLQSNWVLNQAAVALLIESLRPLMGKRVFDLYAGAGNFSLPLCGEAEEVVAVESHPWAVRDGRRNMVRNGIRNCAFLASTAEGMPNRGRPDVLILDPPRTGLTNRVIERVRALQAGRVAYISCNPATLARDLKKLLRCYRIGSVRVVDFFPQTYHIETMVLLEMR